jgi:hypothetical protein
MSKSIAKRKTPKRTVKARARKRAKYKCDRPEYLTPMYQKFVKLVKERDHCRCQFPGCKRRKYGQECHHILPWAKFPQLRYEPSNGIMLCQYHHRLVTGNEMAYVGLFLTIARENAIKQEKMRKYNG